MGKIKLIVLTSKQLGLRYRSHLNQLLKMPEAVELKCVSIHPLGLLWIRVGQHWKILRRKGVHSYLAWLISRRTAQGIRNQIGLQLYLHYESQDFVKNRIPIVRKFFGFSKDFIKFVASEKPDYLMQLGVGLIPKYVIDVVPPILNLHPGILPGIRGSDPFFWGLYYGRSDWLGSTLHIIDHNIDTGQPIVRRKLKHSPGTPLLQGTVAQYDMEVDLLREFFLSPPTCRQSDEGGCQDSHYRGAWSKQDYLNLESAKWWCVASIKTSHKN